MDPLGGDGDRRLTTQPGGGGGGDGGGGSSGGGRGRGRGPWPSMQVPQGQEPRSLRRPHHASSSGITGTADHAETKSDGAKGDIVKNSTLSVDAAEFVPKRYSAVPPAQQSAPVRPSVQDRLNIGRQSQHGPRQHTQHWQTQPQPYVHHEQQSHHRYNMPQRQHHQYSVRPPQHHQYNQYSNVQDYGNYDGGSGDYKHRHQEHEGLEGDGEEWGTGIGGMVGQLEGAMRALTLSPGRFDSLVAPLVDAVTPCLTHPVHAQAIVMAVLRQSINEGNFRYSGARLCTFLDNAALGEGSMPIFRDTLIARCREETEKRMAAWLQRAEDEEDEEGERCCHGLILFLAELVAQMESEPASVLGKLLIKLISAVLQRPARNSAKYICQALKLSGQILERDSCGNGAEMECVMRSLTGLVTEGRVDVHVGRMVHSVDELRRGNWGRIHSTTLHGQFTAAAHPSPNLNPNTQATTDADTIQQLSSNEPVFYGPDGNVLSPEESRFLQDLTEDTPDLEEYGEAEGDEGEADIEAEGLWREDADDGGMDDDIAAAYEQFLKLAPNSRNGGARR